MLKAETEVFSLTSSYAFYRVVWSRMKSFWYKSRTGMGHRVLSAIYAPVLGFILQINKHIQYYSIFKLLGKEKIFSQLTNLPVNNLALYLILKIHQCSVLSDITLCSLFHIIFHYKNNIYSLWDICNIKLKKRKEKLHMYSRPRNYLEYICVSH